jgi:hypothetical protein
MLRPLWGAPRLTTLALFLSLSIAADQDPAKGDSPLSKAELAAITERGRMLADYDFAAWHASDALQAVQPKAGSIVRYIAHKTKEGWTVAFGKLNDSRDAFLVAYEASSAQEPEEFLVKTIDPPRADKGFFLFAARAIDTALQAPVKEIERQRRPYNVAVLPAPDQQLWVYVMPAQTDPGVWPLGGDVRFLISADGTRVVEARPLHKSIIEREPAQAPKNGEQLVAGTHTHVLNDEPVDTDVFHVLARKPPMPEVIVTEKFVYVVEPKGDIKSLGSAKDVLKK